MSFPIFTAGESPYGVSVLKNAHASLAAPVMTTDNPRVNQSEMSVTCVLTSANPDRQGDVIDPLGGDFSEHETNPVVMFHHGKQHKLPIGKAEDRNGNYTVRHMKSPAGNDILVGTTHFAQSNRFAQDVFGLVAEDVLRGVSIGFDPPELESDIDVLGPSPSLDRNAMHFKAWKLLEYSHTPIGVNRDALTVKIEKALEGSLKMHPALLQALQPLSQPRKTVVAVTSHSPAHAKAGCAGMSPKQKAAVAIAKNAGNAKKKAPVKKGYETSINETVGKPSSVPPCPACGGTGAFATRETPYGYECQGCGGGYGLDEAHAAKGWPAFRKKGVIAVVKALDPSTFVRWKKAIKAMDDEDYDDPTDPSDLETSGDSGVGAVDADLAATDPVDGADALADVATDETADAGLAEDAMADGMDADGPTPAVKSYYDASQGLLDLAVMFESGMKKSEHSKARKNASKVIADLRKVAAEVKTFGDKVQAELDKMPVAGEPELPEDESPEDQADAEADPADLETEEDGTLVTKGYTPQRLTFADLSHASAAFGTTVVSRTAPASAPSDSALASQVKALERQLKARDREIAKRDEALNELTDTLEAVARRSGNR